STTGDGSPRPSKRHNADDDTPRPKRHHTKRGPLSSRSAAAESLSVRSSQSESQQHSRRISPQKHLAALELTDHGISLRDLSSLSNPPLPLREFVDAMEQLARGKGVLHPGIKPALASHADWQVSKLVNDDYLFSTNRTQAGHMPTIQSVLQIFADATECQQNLHPEAVWNAHVHTPMLRLALHPLDKPAKTSLVDFVTCPTASLGARYMPAISPSKKIDFCIYIEPSLDPLASSVEPAIETLRQSLPNNTINHTDYYPLRKRPIALSLETKKTGEGWADATLQMGVWQSAHWDQQLQKQPTTTLPDFLPAVIVQGHDWYLVITTQEEKRTVLWTKLFMGTTSSVLGIYQVAYALQLLRNWASRTYWPFLRQVVLDAGRRPTENQISASVPNT
ncbi:hypothetical protein F5883DRAFT_694592, partial [Diaporthe sp. PMI_573]